MYDFTNNMCGLNQRASHRKQRHYENHNGAVPYWQDIIKIAGLQKNRLVTGRTLWSKKKKQKSHSARASGIIVRAGD
jgi:hypothetical protein